MFTLAMYNSNISLFSQRFQQQCSGKFPLVETLAWHYGHIYPIVIVGVGGGGGGLNELLSIKAYKYGGIIFKMMWRY